MQSRNTIMVNVMTAAGIIRELKSLGSPERADVSRWFFKTGKGEYGEGDRFLGVTVPEQRTIAKRNRDLPFHEIEKLLGNPYHEARLTGWLILTYAFEHADDRERKMIFDFAIEHRSTMNNWDLVDTAAPRIVGVFLRNRRSTRRILSRYARSKNLWERRIAIVSTLAFIAEGDFSDTLLIANQLLGDREDLIHKATGWMLREVGKRDESVLRKFLDTHAATMPRTMLRYAIERLSPELRKSYMCCQ